MDCPKCGTKRESMVIKICLNCKHNFGDAGDTSQKNHTVATVYPQPINVVVEDINMNFIRSFIESYLPPNYSAHGHHVDNLIVWTHYLMFVLFVGWGVYFIYTLFKFRSFLQIL